MEQVRNEEDRGRFCVLTSTRVYDILKQGDIPCQDKQESTQRAAFTMQC